MRYRLHFTIPLFNWSQLRAARQIALLPKSLHLVRFVRACASTPRPVIPGPTVKAHDQGSLVPAPGGQLSHGRPICGERKRVIAPVFLNSHFGRISGWERRPSSS